LELCPIQPEIVDNDILYGVETEITRQHEICHVLGMIHEHQRYDRDDFVTFVTVVRTEILQKYLSMNFLLWKFYTHDTRTTTTQ
jgi:hypothetical protein